MGDKSSVAACFLTVWLINFILLVVLLWMFYGGSQLNDDEVRCGSGFPCKSFVVFPFVFGICWAVYQSVVPVIICMEILSQKSLLSSLLLSAVVFLLDFAGLCIWTAVIVIIAVPKTIENNATPSGTSSTSTQKEFVTYNEYMTTAAILTGIMTFCHYIYTFFMALLVYDNYNARRADRKEIRKKAAKTPMYEVVPAPWAPPIPQQPMPLPGTPTEAYQPGMPTGEPAPMSMPIQDPPVAKMV